MKLSYLFRVVVVAAVGLCLAATSAAAASLDSRPRTTVAKISLYSVTCPLRTRCVAVGTTIAGAGVAAVITPASGKARLGRTTVRNIPLKAVGCATASTCVGAANGDIVRISASTGKAKVSGKLPQPKAGAEAVGSIACPSKTSCYAVGYRGTSENSVGLLVHASGSGALLGTTTEKGSSYIGTIACSSKTSCLASSVNRSGLTSIQVLTSGKPGRGRAIPAHKFIQALACHGTGCYALAGTETDTHRANLLIRLDPRTGAAGKSIRLPSAFSGEGLACATATRCVVVGFVGEGTSERGDAIVVTGGNVGKLKRLSGIPASVACSSPSLCTAVGSLPGRRMAAVVDRVAV